MRLAFIALSLGLLTTLSASAVETEKKASSSAVEAASAQAKSLPPATVETASAVPAATDFIRFLEDATGAYMQTGNASYVSPQGVQVDLIGAIHIADKSYYEALNARFNNYDAVLYELVGRPVKERVELKAGDGSGRLRWLGQLQETMRRSLALESQLSAIDYHAPNFVHADMSLEGFFESQEEKKESFIGLWWKAVKAQGAATTSTKRAQPGLGRLLELMVQKDSATELKRLIGREFDVVEEIVAGIESEGGSAIIGERNRHALEVMQSEIKAGKKRLAIFYGAAHLPDMEARLLKQGYKLKKVEWLSAWTLPPEPPTPVPKLTPQKSIDSPDAVKPMAPSASPSAPESEKTTPVK